MTSSSSGSRCWLTAIPAAVLLMVPVCSSTLSCKESAEHEARLDEASLKCLFGGRAWWFTTSWFLVHVNTEPDCESTLVFESCDSEVGGRGRFRRSGKGSWLFVSSGTSEFVRELRVLGAPEERLGYEVYVSHEDGTGGAMTSTCPVSFEILELPSGCETTESIYRHRFK